MKTYPYTTDDGIIELVRNERHDAVVVELERELNAARSQLTSIKLLLSYYSDSIDPESTTNKLKNPPLP